MKLNVRFAAVLTGLLLMLLALALDWPAVPATSSPPPLSATSNVVVPTASATWQPGTHVFAWSAATPADAPASPTTTPADPDRR